MDFIKEALKESSEIKLKMAENLSEKIESLIRLMVEAIGKNKKILLMGNGGSAADAQHFEAELVGRYKLEREAIPAISLNTNTSSITAIGNDYSFDRIFSRQVEAFGEEGDILIGISTSGLSENLVQAFETARKRGLKTVALLGKGGGKIKERVDFPLIVPSDNTPRIQEAHITIIHILCEEIEKRIERKD